MIRILLLIGVFHAMIYATPMYVMSAEINVMEAPSMDGNPITKLRHGTKINVQKSSGIWVYIQTKTTQGWVCKFNLVDHDPKQTSVIEAIQRTNLNKRARKRASSYSTAATTRGFNESEDKIATTSDFMAVKRMMTFLPTPTEVTDFMEKGQLNHQ